MADRPISEPFDGLSGGSIFEDVERAFAEAERRGRAAIVRKEASNYDRTAWLFRHVELWPGQDYLSEAATVLAGSPLGAGLDTPQRILRFLAAVRAHYADWCKRELPGWTVPGATRAHHLDALKVVYHGELKRLLALWRIGNQSRAVGALVFGRAAE